MGMLMLAAVLERAGHEVRLLDANAAGRKRTRAEIVKIAADMRPDVIGMTLVTPLVKEAYQLASELRGCGAKLLAGGPHATLLPEEPLNHGFDAVVVGEGEPTVVEAVEALLNASNGEAVDRGDLAESVCYRETSSSAISVLAAPEVLCRQNAATIALEQVRGLVFRRADGSIRHNELRPPVADLDALPPPARHLVDPSDFGSTPDLHAHVFTSRGCPARCAYCAGGLFGKKFRFRSADSVVDEMIELHRQYGTRHFYFMDDAMSMDRPRMRQICQRLIDERLGLTWNMMTRIDAVDEELLDLAARAGCVQIEYGVESGSADTLKRIHKPHTVQMVRHVIPLTQRYGIRPMVFFILGFPWEDAGQIEDTRRLMEQLAPYVVFQPAIASVLIPFPGTEIYERYKDEYGLADWWLSDDRTYDAPRPETHPFYQTLMFQRGMVLDADFFRYPPATKAKIHDVFRFMYASNLRHRRWLFRMAALMAIDVSRKAHGFSPRLERWVFRGPLALRRMLQEARRHSS
jgi:anaerobic magnesium-protoporphyrin IX monomethyl ester cyclase